MKRRRGLSELRFLVLKPERSGLIDMLISSDDSEEIVKARCHYTRAEVDRIIYDLYYDAHVQASDGEPDYICRISEMFESVDRTLYFTTQWYYRSTVTIIKDKYISDPKCVFFSEIRNDNPLECLTWKLNIVRLALNVDPENRRARSSGCDFYCDMLYLLPYSTFVRLPTENNTTGPESSTISNDIDAAGVKSECDEVCETSGSSKSEVALLDLYSGCGAMSTGLCLGLNLVTKWAVDLNINACQSLRLNHPETQGDVDVICGGPPCQGISGFNRFRNTKSPLDDPKNKQLIVFMDTVDFLRPKFVLIENVVDLLKFADGFIGRYAMGCLTNMKYQARLGMLGHTVFRSFVCGFFYGVLAQLRSHHNILSPLMMCLGEVSHL
uniref:DNA (cytosine-5-)-methyltransferase n=1 Tax=Populus trichocarpa TaxID=3694 RepID=A0A3N7FPX3_POPTR